MNRRWLFVIVPLVVGLTTAFVISRSALAGTILFLRVDLGTFSILLGAILALLAAIWIAYSIRNERLIHQSRIHSVEERRRFLRRLDHELKNPLTAILAGLANISQANTDPQRDKAMHSTEEQVQRLRRLVADLRKLSDLDTRQLELAPVDLNALLTDTFTLIHEHALANERNLQLTTPQAPWPLPEISADRDLLFLAIHNLLDNALKFSQPGDTIEVRAFEDRDHTIVEIADTGPGIPDNEVPHVWEELFRGDSARGIPGSGLGLALVKAIILRHGGQVNIRSRTGTGTVFTIRLPSTSTDESS